MPGYIVGISLGNLSFIVRTDIKAIISTSVFHLE